MLNFIFGTPKKKIDRLKELREIYAKLKAEYPPQKISQDRKEYLRDTINAYGYRNMSYAKA